MARPKRIKSVDAGTCHLCLKSVNSLRRHRCPSLLTKCEYCGANTMNIVKHQTVDDRCANKRLMQARQEMYDQGWFPVRNYSYVLRKSNAPKRMAIGDKKVVMDTSGHTFRLEFVEIDYYPAWAHAIATQAVPAPERIQRINFIVERPSLLEMVNSPAADSVRRLSFEAFSAFVFERMREEWQADAVARAALKPSKRGSHG